MPKSPIQNGPSSPAEPSPVEGRRRRVRRAEAFLDRWLDLYELLLERAHVALSECDAAPKLPDLSRLTDLANAFTITRRACEIELLARKLGDSDPMDEGFDPELLLQAIQEDDQQE